uniref:DNA-directed RNA polymerase n=1 Tax=Arthromyces claviformis TaxID=530043 RepID=A0A8F1ADY7_9AGAR|nr:RNA polymerase [Arthromyces claviformis]
MKTQTESHTQIESQNPTQRQKLKEENLKYKHLGFHLFTLSAPTKLNSKNGNQIRSCIASTAYVEELNIDKDSILTRMVSLNKNKLCIVYIKEDTDLDLKGHEFRVSWDYKGSTLEVFHVSLKYFFSLEGLDFFFSTRKWELIDTVFIVQGLRWDTICAYFGFSMMQISGGSYTKRHLLSPNQIRLTLILICLLGSETYPLIIKSFHNYKKLNSKNFDYSSKLVESVIMDFAKSNDELRERLLLSTRVSKNNNLETSLMDKESLNTEKTSNNEQSHLYSSVKVNENTNDLESNENETNKGHPTEINSVGGEYSCTGKPYLVEGAEGAIGKNRKYHTSANLLSSKSLNSNRFNSNIAKYSSEFKDILVSPQPSKPAILMNTTSTTPTSYNNSTIFSKNLSFPCESFHNITNIENIKNIEKLENNENIENTSEISRVSSGSHKKTKIEVYLDSIKGLILEVESNLENETRKRELQEQLENIVINREVENLQDEKYLITRHQNKLYSIIGEAGRTLDIMHAGKYLDKKFPELSSGGTWDDLNRQEFLIITFSLCISLYSRLSYNALAIKIGEEILYSIYKHKYLNQSQEASNSKNNKVQSNKFYKFYNYKEDLKIDKVFLLKLGDFFMSLLQRYPHDLFNRKINIDSYFSQIPFLLEINPEYLEDIKNNILINPSTLPMICKPIEWTQENFGGYLSNETRNVDIITSRELSHNVENKELIYKTVNYFNSIKFAINKNLLDYILSNEGAYILDSIKAEDELQRELTLHVAKLYKNIYFYLNTHTDWRGRVYTQSFFLSYQAGDLSSALLNFWEGEPISEKGKFYLYIYGANSHNENGISKASYADRIKWVKNNYKKIINLDKELILSADLPFIFTAFCLNMKEIHINPKAIIKTPIFLDATCSGIQHLAALMKDLELGANTNLLPSNKEDKPEDIYSVLLDHINKKINEYGNKYPEYGILKLIKLTRKEIKTSVMTKVYNVTIYGMAQQLKTILAKVEGVMEKDKNKEGSKLALTKIKEPYKINELFEEEFHKKPIKKIKDKLSESIKGNKSKTKFICKSHDGKPVELEGKDIYKIATIINDEIFVRFPALNNIYNYFTKITDITSKLGVPLTWITPTGLKITQEYLKKKQTVITVSIFGRSKRLVLRENEDKLNKLKQKQAIIPNMVHSLDASHLMNLIKSAAEINFYPIITIHDCFGTLPNKMSELDFIVRKEFIIIYSNGEFIKNFHNRFIQSITDNQYQLDNKNNPKYIIIGPNDHIPIPSVPLLGNLDIENIKNSKYMIS